MICGTAHRLQAAPAFVLTVSFAIGCERAHPYHSSPTAWRPHVLTTPWETIYPSSLRSDSDVRSAYGSCRVD
jgi:hypothetical protein